MMGALFILIGCILIAAWQRWYRLGLTLFCIELLLVLLMFWHHVTEDLHLNF